jgi:hypothetical protein
MQKKKRKKRKGKVCNSVGVGVAKKKNSVGVGCLSPLACPLGKAGDSCMKCNLRLKYATAYRLLN